MNGPTFAATGPAAAPLVVTTSARGTTSLPAQLEQLLTLCKQRHASDVHITGGSPAYFRIQSEVVPIGESLPPEVVAQMTAALMTEAQRRVFAEQQQLDLAFFSADH